MLPDNNEKTGHCQAYSVIRPRQLQFPAVFSSPHSGSAYPEAFIASSALCPRGLRSSEDCHVDKLFSGAVELGCPLLAANFPRAYLDVNREPYELDPSMFADPLPPYVNTTSARVAGGLGTIPRIVAENNEIYSTKLTWADARSRIENFYQPYHDALRTLTDETLEVFGSVLLIDCHSMPSTAVQHTAGRDGKRAGIVLGDRYGATCDAYITEYLAELFNGAGLSTVRNKPYAGGYITQTYGKSGHTKQALQIEINRSLYMNEHSLEISRDFVALRTVLTKTLNQFLIFLAGQQQPGVIAAE